MGRIEDKVVLVTGGARGLGRSHCVALAKEGADITVLDVGEDREVAPGYRLSGRNDLEETARLVKEQGRQAIAFAGDVTKQKDLDAAVAATLENFGKLDILVANAGIALGGPTWEMSREDWDRQIAVNMTGVWQSCKAVIPHMIEREQGRIICISSMAGYKCKGFKGIGPYAATKAGIIALAESLALELAEHWITVNCICPSAIPTGASKGLATVLGFTWEEITKMWLKTQSIKTLLEPIDISNAVLFLASDEARYITGVSLPVDAGVGIVHGGLD